MHLNWIAFKIPQTDVSVRNFAIAITTVGQKNSSRYLTKCCLKHSKTKP